jgi:hypothetical protein
VKTDQAQQACHGQAYQTWLPKVSQNGLLAILFLSQNGYGIHMYILGSHLAKRNLYVKRSPCVKRSPRRCEKRSPYAKKGPCVKRGPMKRKTPM